MKERTRVVCMHGTVLWGSEEFFSVSLWLWKSIFKKPLSRTLEFSRHFRSTLLGRRHCCAGTSGTQDEDTWPRTRSHCYVLSQSRHSHEHGPSHSFTFDSSSTPHRIYFFPFSLSLTDVLTWSTVQLPLFIFALPVKEKHVAGLFSSRNLMAWLTWVRVNMQPN